MTHPIINILKEEWGYLGKRRRLFLLYVSFFVVAGVLDLTTPYIIGSIFNSIQQSITTREELNNLMFKISLLLVVTIIFWIFHGVARVLEQPTGFFVMKNYINDKIRIVLFSFE